MKWQQDLTHDIRFNDQRDDYDGGSWQGFPHPQGYESGHSGEFTVENKKYLEKYFDYVKRNYRAILEIGVCRNSSYSSTHSFLKYKNPNTIYVGIDLDDKSFLNDISNNIYTIKNTSSDINQNMAIMKSFGVTKFDFIFIDGLHSVNQLLIDWEYTQWLGEGGMVGFHDVTCHPGPERFVGALNTDKWNVEKNLCPEDWGIGFAWPRHY